MQRWLFAGFALIAAFVFVLAQRTLASKSRITPSTELEVVLPLFVQVAMAGGDRYLAANLGAIRALVTETQHMGVEDFALLGRLQDNVSWLNPAHEDNYYTAAAILSWENQLERAQHILARATQARPYDYQPPFFYAFNLVNFHGDGLGAALWLRDAALRLPDPQERLAMENLAARWIERSQDLRLAISVVDAMAKNTARKDFSRYLKRRVDRLRGLLVLREAANEYQNKYGKKITRLDDLVTSGVIAAIPQDPLGIGFNVTPDGTPSLDSGRHHD